MIKKEQYMQEWLEYYARHGMVEEFERLAPRLNGLLSEERMKELRGRIYGIAIERNIGLARRCSYKEGAYAHLEIAEDYMNESGLDYSDEIGKTRELLDSRPWRKINLNVGRKR